MQFADPAMRVRLFANIKRCLKPGGTLTLREYEAELQEGSQHKGRSALIGMVARRR